MVCAALFTALSAAAAQHESLPPFDGLGRPCTSDPERADAYLRPPPCPHSVKDCKESSNHCAFLAELPSQQDSNEVLLSWFSGYKEGWDETGVVIARLNLTEGTPMQWGDAQVVSSATGFSAQNPVLLIDSSSVYMFHTRQPKGNKDKYLSKPDPVPSQEKNGKLWISESADRGITWSNATLVIPDNGTWGRNDPIRGLDGSWMLPLYNESLKPLGHDHENSLILRVPSPSDRDHGSNLNLQSLPPASLWSDTMFPSSGYLVQPSIVRLKPGQPKLRAFFRDRRAMWIYSSTSADDGKTWSVPVATSLPNNNAGIHAIVLRSGAVAVAYNDMQGQTKGNLRTVLAIALSDDGGASFPTKRVLEQHKNATHTRAHERQQQPRRGHRSYPSATMAPEPELQGVGPSSCDCYSYPTVLQLNDTRGTVLVAFTYQRRTIKVSAVTEAWIRNTSGVLCD